MDLSFCYHPQGGIRPLEENFLWGIRLARAVSATVEVTAVILLMRMQDAGSMLRLNAVLGLVGPFVLITVNALGLAAEMGKVHPSKLLMILGGVILIVLGTRN